MNKKILFLIIMFLLMLNSISYADTCEVARTKDVLRKNLYLHLKNPSSSPLTLNQVKDLLIFYLGIAPSLTTVDCSASGSSSSTLISVIVNNGDSAPNTIPACSEGTKYGECSNIRPKFCYGGSIINKCSSCGCPSGNICSIDNCNPSGSNITCFSNLDCGANQFTGSYYCSNNSITRNYLSYTCTNPGTTSSSCVSSNTPTILNYCDPFLNKTCVAGYAVCQVIAPDIIPPNVSITSPASGVTVSGVIAISAAASDNVGVGGVQFRVDSFNIGAEDTTFPYSITWDSSTVTNGNHIIIAIARDTSWNTATSQGVSINVSNVISDTTPPTASITSPTSGTKVNSTITVSATASDNIGVVGVQFKLDSSNLGAEDTTAPYSILWDTTTTTNGAHTLTSFARDAAGNTNTSPSIAVNVSNPTNLNPVAIINYTLVSNLSVRFNGSLSYDPDGFITSYNWIFGDGTQSNLTAVTHTYSSASLYLVNLTVRDNLAAANTQSKFINVT